MRWRLLTHPVFTGSVALLAVNDHVLKARWPGLITGKLSDIAGVVMIALACTAITGRATLSIRFTAVAFALLKTWPPVAAWAAPILGGVTRNWASLCHGHIRPGVVQQRRWWSHLVGQSREAHGLSSCPANVAFTSGDIQFHAIGPPTWASSLVLFALLVSAAGLLVLVVPPLRRPPRRGLAAGWIAFGGGGLLIGVFMYHHGPPHLPPQPGHPARLHRHGHHRLEPERPHIASATSTGSIRERSPEFRVDSEGIGSWRFLP
jgi:hypothetical protein